MTLIGRGQMTVLDSHIARRREIHAIYRDRLSGIRGVTLPENPSEKYQSNFWLTCVQVDADKAGFTREDLRLAMEVANIETRPLWKPMHLQPVFADAPFYGDGTSEKLFEKGLCLPSSPVLSDEDINRVVEVFEKLQA
ncbi:dTDP-4-amino-4,6-dideoxygalactose transaminase [Microbacter margulisiae]|uniref:dTDP-4-amino-4,6-dideoxygalactose transaminase n=1 Tax=Microbacter margulisiae TaxID=1350067 RepID=A0A7W5H0Q8_9PORP|nr:dTDP-4-amino-4,6-dideoxygalactose transaminase [Microbacter margulisiae]